MIFLLGKHCESEESGCQTMYAWACRTIFICRSISGETHAPEYYMVYETGGAATIRAERELVTKGSLVYTVYLILLASGTRL